MRFFTLTDRGLSDGIPLQRERRRLIIRVGHQAVPVSSRLEKTPAVLTSGQVVKRDPLQLEIPGGTTPGEIEHAGILIDATPDTWGALIRWSNWESPHLGFHARAEALGVGVRAAGHLDDVPIFLLALPPNSGVFLARNYLEDRRLRESVIVWSGTGRPGVYPCSLMKDFRRAGYPAPPPPLRRRR